MALPPSQMFQMHRLERIPDVRAGEEVVVGVREHVVEPGADDAERHRPEGDVEHDARLGAALREAARGDDDGEDDADEDAQRVRVDRRAATRTGDLEGSAMRGPGSGC